MLGDNSRGQRLALCRSWGVDLSTVHLPRIEVRLWEALLLGNAQMIPDPRVVQRMARLTPRERQVLELIMRQKLNKQIGAMLGIAETTVKGYRRALMSKLGATNTTELVLLAVRAGLYPPKS